MELSHVLGNGVVALKPTSLSCLISPLRVIRDTIILYSGITVDDTHLEYQ